MSKRKAQGGLGFKDIEAFNLALLGKQLWRMMTQPNSLIAKVFKARYFQKSDPLHAKLGSRPSYAWRSIHASQQWIKKGSRKIIGDGANTSIWEDHWIDQKPARPILSTLCNPDQVPPQHSKSSLVKDLLIPGSRVWNEEIIRDSFGEEDRKRILEIRAGGPNSTDSYSWDYTKTGHYTFKSGYWVITNVPPNPMVDQELNQPSLDTLFQMAWQSDANPKIHHFLWKCLSNCISVAGNLKKRHILKDSRCMRCHAKEETVNHMLFECPFARLVWALSGFPAPPNGEMASSFYANFFRVMNVAVEHPQATGMENLGPLDLDEWTNRVEKNSQSGTPKTNPGTQASHREHWTPPPAGWLKCNVDGAWSHRGDHSGVGWVLRDDKGKVLWMGAKRIHKTQTVVEAELEALRWAAEFVTSLRYQNIIFESDSKEAVEVISFEDDWPKYRAVAQDLRKTLKNLCNYKIVFHSRAVNMVADRIARETNTYVDYVPKVYSISPNWIKSYVAKDTLSCNVSLE
ncbi:unnamed protein product [Microthlaspi erraticum]|uniref:Uncharacterized protein n=1 Tax=Microthlaspi erraticum TaxID=1685480 RepID=A0A6D2IMK4_9BRAS|nr:unnamed protein product [Microthlaspi erraticum]